MFDMFITTNPINFLPEHILVGCSDYGILPVSVWRVYQTGMNLWSWLWLISAILRIVHYVGCHTHYCWNDPSVLDPCGQSRDEPWPLWSFLASRHTNTYNCCQWKHFKIFTVRLKAHHTGCYYYYINFNLYRNSSTWEFHFEKVTQLGTVVFAYIWIVPACIWAVLWWRGNRQKYTLLQLLAIYGYSMGIFIPLTVSNYCTW